MKRADEDIKMDVVDQLYWDDRINASEVAVRTEDGTVTLEGSVPTYRSRIAATEDAMGVSGVTSLNNNLAIRYAEESLPDDAQLRKDAVQVLRWDPDIEDSDIEVEIMDGVVTLRGSVPSLWQKIEVERDVERLAGIMAVHNDLAVVPTENIDDARIAHDISEALERSNYVVVEDLNVRVENGDVSLSGIVPSPYSKDSAVAIAQYTSGVRNVDSDALIVS